MSPILPMRNSTDPATNRSAAPSANAASCNSTDSAVYAFSCSQPDHIESTSIRNAPTYNGNEALSGLVVLLKSWIQQMTGSSKPRPLNNKYKPAAKNTNCKPRSWKIAMNNNIIQ